MIVGDIRNWEQQKHAFSPVIQKAVDFIRTRHPMELEPGKYEMMGEDMFALVQEITTAPRTERKSECHAKYVDIQYLADGDEEWIGVTQQSVRNVPVEDRLADKDYALYDDVEGETEICLKPGMFAVFFPSDLHRPGCSRDGGTQLKKVVFKINIALFAG